MKTLLALILVSVLSFSANAHTIEDAGKSLAPFQSDFVLADIESVEFIASIHWHTIIAVDYYRPCGMGPAKTFITLSKEGVLTISLLQEASRSSLFYCLALPSLETFYLNITTELEKLGKSLSELTEIVVNRRSEEAIVLSAGQEF